MLSDWDASASAAEKQLAIRGGGNGGNEGEVYDQEQAHETAAGIMLDDVENEAAFGNFQLSHETLFSVDKMAEIVESGTDAQKAMVMVEIQQMLDHCLGDTLRVLVPVVCMYVHEWSVELQISAAEALLEIVHLTVPPDVAKMISAASFRVVKTATIDTIYEAWGEILVAILPAVRWRDDELERVLALVDAHASRSSEVSRKLSARVLGSLSVCLDANMIETRILPRTLELSTDRDVEVRGMTTESLAFVGAALRLDLVQRLIWPEMQRLLNDYDPRIHAAALRSLAQIILAQHQRGAATDAAAPLFCELLPPVFEAHCHFARKTGAEDQRTVNDDAYLLLEIFAEVFGVFLVCSLLPPGQLTPHTVPAYRAAAAQTPSSSFATVADSAPVADDDDANSTNKADAAHAGAVVDDGDVRTAAAGAAAVDAPTPGAMPVSTPVSPPSAGSASVAALSPAGVAGGGGGGRRSASAFSGGAAAATAANLALRTEAYRAFLTIATCNGPVVRRHCAYNLPGVCAVLAEQHAEELSNIAEFLSRDPDPETRWNLAAGLLETVRMLRKGVASDNLFKVFVALVRDENPLVRVNALQHFADVMQLLVHDGDDAAFKKVAVVFQSIHALSEGNWRTQRLLVSQLSLVADHIPRVFLRNHVLPALFQIAEDSIFLVRREVMHAVVHAVRCLALPAEQDDLLSIFRVEWSQGGVYWMRAAFLEAALHAAATYSRALFQKLFAAHTLRLAADPVVNVRVKLALHIHELAPLCGELAEFTSAVELLADDDDADVCAAMSDAAERVRESLADRLALDAEDARRAEEEARMLTRSANEQANAARSKLLLRPGLRFASAHGSSLSKRSEDVSLSSPKESSVPAPNAFKSKSSKARGGAKGGKKSAEGQATGLLNASDRSVSTDAGGDDGGPSERPKLGLTLLSGLKNLTRKKGSKN